MGNYIAEVRSEAIRRERQVRPGGRILNEHSHSVGLEGEYAFSLYSGLPIDLSARPAGDCGVDFVLPTTLGDFNVDVKTATHLPPWLLVPVDECREMTIYVLASYVGDVGKLWGWEWGKRVKKGERGRFAREDMENYRLMVKDLRPMLDLLLALRPK